MNVKDILNTGVIKSNAARVNSLGLALFNSVLKVNDESGYVITDGFALPKSAGDVVSDVSEYVSENVLTNDKLRKTFLKSWTQSSIYWEEMVAHIGGVYALGYGSLGTYTFPADVVNGVPQGTKLFVVGVMTPTEFADKVLGMFASGIAMKQETLEKMFALLDALGYEWSGDEVIKNKEAQLLIADMYNVLPKDGDAFLRYLIYKVTDSTLLIKSSEVIKALNESSCYEYLNSYLQTYGNFNKLAEVFLRHKPIFLALKRASTAKYINRISKLAKKYHKPTKVNPLNNLAYGRLTFDDLNKATPFAIFRALNYCHNRLHDFRDSRYLTYKIRNGKIKVVVKDADKFLNNSNLRANQTTLVSFIQQNLSDKIRGKKVYIPEGVKYALPTSEKKMLGGVPFGTRVYSNERLCAGVYWKNEWGATDFDLSATTPTERIGWNSKWASDRLKYSGDITSAPSGASEYMVNLGDMDTPVLLINNRYSGQPNAEYQISIGKASDASLDGRGFMMSEDRLIFQSPKIKSESREMYVGAFIPVPKNVYYEYVVFNLRSGSSRVSSADKSNELKSIIQEYTKQVTLNWLIISLGATRAETAAEADIDLTPSNLTTTTIVDLFSK